MRKTTLASMDGWTPVFDSIVDKHGPFTALVFGVIWRYCQMRTGVCTASQATLAKKIGVDRKVVNRHIRTLVKYGYLSEYKIFGKPSIYKDTGVARMRVSIIGDEQQYYYGTLD